MKRSILSIATIFVIATALVIDAHAQRDESISVKVGETKTANSSGIKINFISVLEDSRCPRDANCIWAGQARIQITVESKDGQAMTVELSTNGEKKSVKVSGYLVHFTKLDPVPTTAQAPEQAEYSAWFRFESL